MDFGKLPSVDHLRFSLPPSEDRSLRILSSFSNVHSPSGENIFVGAPVWVCPKWVGSIYPKKLPSSQYLSEYGKHFNSVELNSTFYQIPHPDRIRHWKEQVPSGFKFSPKFHQSISHFENFQNVREQLNLFFNSIQYFEEKLGICFLQIPPHFSIQSIELLKRLFQWIPRQYRVAVEFRHSSWFEDQKLKEAAYRLMIEFGFSTVITDVAGRRDVLHASLTNKSLLIRFTGNEQHPSDFTRLDAWAERLQLWIQQGLEEIFFYIHQPDELGVPELARYFSKKMNAAFIAGLPSLPKDENSQIDLFSFS